MGTFQVMDFKVCNVSIGQIWIQSRACLYSAAIAVVANTVMGALFIDVATKLNLHYTA